MSEAIEALKIFSFVGIPSTSLINQVLLQLVRKNVNQLSLQQIIFLDYLIRQFKNTPLSDALLIALPIVFEVHVTYQLDRENVTQVMDCLQYVSRKNVSDSTVELLVEALRQKYWVSFVGNVKLTPLQFQEHLREGCGSDFLVVVRFKTEGFVRSIVA